MSLGADDRQRWERFADSENLRSVLIRLHVASQDAWRTDPEADDLMRFAIDRFAALARKHDLEPEDSAVAAWLAMRDPGIPTSTDPWGSIVKAVVTTFNAAQFANEALCSVETARNGGLTGRTVERFSERDIDGNHPALAPRQTHRVTKKAPGCRALMSRPRT